LIPETVIAKVFAALVASPVNVALSVIAGVLAGLATVPEKPFAVTTETAVTPLLLIQVIVYPSTNEPVMVQLELPLISDGGGVIWLVAI
jgi:hypothetical protein